MSSVQIVKFPGEVANLEAVIGAHLADFEAISEQARSIGCLHHRFVGGRGELVLIDEWRDVEAAVKIFSFHPEAAALLREAGVQPAIESAFYHSIHDPTEF